MNFKLINGIIIGITVALIGLVAIQVKWIKQSYAVREEKFDQGVALRVEYCEPRY
jgi:hypothetical protein